MKKEVYFNEFNLLMGDSTYLPLVSGILHAYCLQSELIAKHYEFMPYHFHIDAVDTIVAKFKNPSIAAFSVSMWNEQLSLKVARKVKAKFPQCKIIFGGAQVPHDGRDYLKEHGFIDFTVKGEGEDAFREILEANITSIIFPEITSVTYRNEQGEIQQGTGDRDTSKDLDVYPSPYTLGLYDKLIEDNPHFNFQAIIETNRGCPFKCTFCYWGMGGLRRKYRFHSLERVDSEINWIAQNKIAYVFNADSNFGMHRRDEDIATMLIEAKKEHGFPEKFRTCYGKNTDDRIFQIGSRLHEHQLEKGITISYQSVDDQVQENIKRDNIKLSVASELQRKFNELNVPVYTELILGLPGESITTWKNGIDQILNSGLKNQLFLYICEVLPNTDLADPDYQKLHGVKSRRIELTEIHVSPREEGWVKENEDIIIETKTMPLADWKTMLCFSWVTMLFHSLKISFYIMAFTRREYQLPYSQIISCLSDGNFDKQQYPQLARIHAAMHAKADRILDGEGRGVLSDIYGGIYWEIEEILFLEISKVKQAFYQELRMLLCEQLTELGISFDQQALEEVCQFQALLIPESTKTKNSDYQFNYNLPEYFDHIFTSREIDLLPEPQFLRIDAVDFAGDLEKFARETVLWKRKNGTFLNTYTWERALAEAAL